MRLRHVPALLVLTASPVADLRPRPRRGMSGDADGISLDGLNGIGTGVLQEWRGRVRNEPDTVGKRRVAFAGLYDKLARTFAVNGLAGAIFRSGWQAAQSTSFFLEPAHWGHTMSGFSSRALMGPALWYWTAKRVRP